MSARAINISREDVGNEKPFIGNARPISVTDQDMNRFHSLINAPLKGLYKGALDIAKILPLSAQGPNIIPYLLTGKSIWPKKAHQAFEKGIQKGEEYLEEALPTRPEVAESILERFGKIAPYALGGPETLLAKGLRSGLSALAGQATEELGGGPLEQGIAEVVPFGLPSLARKIIPKSAEQKAIVSLGRQHGLTEEQLAPLMPETQKRRTFGKFAHAGEGAQESVKETHKGVQQIYQFLASSPQAKQFLSNRQLHKFAIDMNAIGKKLPHAVRSQLQHDAVDLVQAAMSKGGLSGEELFNFYHDISSRYNIGRSQLELFKNPIRDALKSIDPNLAKDFETVNKMFKKSLQIGRILKPSEYEHLISLGEAYELGASAANLDPQRLTKLLGFVGFRKLSEKMLTSPRLQNLIFKSQIAVKQNQLPLLKKIGEELQKEFEDHSE